MNSPAGERRPRTVTWAIGCLGVALVIGTSILAFPWGFPEPALLTLVVIGLLLLATALRQNWARWILTGVTITGLIMMRGLLRFQLTYDAIVGTATVVQISLELVGCCLLFLPRSRHWFARSAPVVPVPPAV